MRSRNGSCLGRLFRHVIEALGTGRDMSIDKIAMLARSHQNVTMCVRNWLSL